MSPTNPVQELHLLSRSFGAAAAREKRRLLETIATTDRLPARDLRLLQDTLEFLRAYPDDAATRARANGLASSLRDRLPEGGIPGLEDSGFPGSVNQHYFCFEVLRRMVPLLPDCLEVDWDALEEDTPLSTSLGLLLLAAENEGMEDLRSSWPEWAAACRAAPEDSDLQVLLRVFEHGPLDPEQRAALFDSCGFLIRYALRHAGTGRCEIAFPDAPLRYQKKDLPRERFPLEPRIREPIESLRPVSVRAGEELIGRCLVALCARNLEIFPLSCADARDVIRFRGARGIEVILTGVRPEHRASLSVISFFLVLKNGVPVAYGPASVLLGCCEMGINLFPEFRGGEIRYIYSQVMRLLHHRYAADYFYLTSYGMGEGNADAIRSGAFWFYRKMGFRASNPVVEALAREEEARMAAKPGYRSDVRMLRRLSDTEAYLDLSEGSCRRFHFDRLTLAVGRFVGERFGGNRDLARRRCGAEVARALGADDLRSWSEDELQAFRRLAPILAMIPDLAAWSRRDQRAALRIARDKGGASEARGAVGLRTHRRLDAALRQIIAR